MHCSSKILQVYPQLMLKTVFQADKLTQNCYRNMNIFFLKTGTAEFNRFYKWIFLHIIPAQIIFPCSEVFALKQYWQSLFHCVQRQKFTMLAELVQQVSILMMPNRFLSTTILICTIFYHFSNRWSRYYPLW